MSLGPSAGVVSDREAARSKTSYTDWSAEELDGGLPEETPWIGLRIASSRQTPEQTVHEILGRARKEAAV